MAHRTRMHFLIEQVGNIRPCAGEKIIHTKDVIALFNQAITKVAADETRPLR